MNTLYHSLIKAITRAIGPHQAGHGLPAAHPSQGFHEFVLKFKSNAGRFKR